MSKTYVSAAVRRLVYERANHACEYCLMPEIGDSTLVTDESS
ncbi:MAG: hypothetical protein RID09_13975 [Coleofasciculus sp. G1-WW12-02]